MNPARRVFESGAMRATKSARHRAQSQGRPRKSLAAEHSAKTSSPVRVIAPAAPEPALYRFCKPGWAVLVDRSPHAQGTRFVCPFCRYSHRVPGPVRGFRKIRRAQWVKLRRVEE